MGTNINTNPKNHAVLFLVLKTIAILLLVVILVGLIWSLAAPASAGSLFYSVGFKKTSARVSLRAANQSKKMADYYTALVRADDGNSYKVAAYAGQTILQFDGDSALFNLEAFNNFCTNKDAELKRASTTTAQEIRSLYVYAQMRANKGKDEGNAFFGVAKDNCVGTSIYYYYNAVNCPITSYINAVIDVNNDDALATAYNILVNLRNIDESMTSTGNYYWRTNKDGSTTHFADSSKYTVDHIYMKQDIKRLLDAKEIDLAAVTAYKQKLEENNKSGEQYLSAFNYWINKIAD